MYVLFYSLQIKDPSHQLQVHLNLECLHDVVESRASVARNIGDSEVSKAKDVESSEIWMGKGVKDGRIAKAKVRTYLSLSLLTLSSVLETPRSVYEALRQGIGAFYQDAISPGSHPLYLAYRYAFISQFLSIILSPKPRPTPTEKGIVFLFHLFLVLLSSFCCR